MNFLVPAFLAGLVALAVPVVLHLRQRDRERPQRFPSLMFLERLPIRTDAQRRITDWPLLLLRALVLALLAIAFARPLLPREARALAAGEAGTTIVLLDRSMSMAHGRTWQAALDSARAVLGGARGDRVALVAFDDAAEVLQPLTNDVAPALAALARVAPVPRATSYAAALRAARQVASAARSAAVDAVVITDLQRSGIAGVAGLDLPAGLHVRTVAVAGEPRANASIASVDAQRAVVDGRPTVVVRAEVQARGPGGRLDVAMSVNGRAAGVRTISLEDDGSASVAFDPVVVPAGLLRGQVVLPGDALPMDDTAHFAVGAPAAMGALLVSPDDASGAELLYLQRALAIGDDPRVGLRHVVPGQLTDAVLATARTVILWDAPLPSGRGGAALEEWVRRGGGLALVAGRRLSIGRQSGALAPATADGMADRMADRGATLGDVRMDHPLFAMFRTAPSAITDARFLRYARLAPRGTAETIARFDDGLPAVVEQRVGAGRVVMVAMGMDARSGDFPLQPAYLPFVRRLATYTGAWDAAPAAAVTGERWLLPVAARQPVVRMPDGSIARPARDSGAAVVPLRITGIHTLHDGSPGGEAVAMMAVNTPPAESDLTPAAGGALLVGVTQRGTLLAGGGEAPVPADVEREQGLWRLLVAAVALLLLVEVAVASHGRRGTAVPLPEG